VEFGILGPLVVTQDDHEVRIGAAKQRALLTLLLLRRGELVPTDVLVEEIWNGSPPATAVKSVQVYVSQLRKALGDGMLETRPGGYVLGAGAGAATIDADRFEELLSEGHRLLAEGDAESASRTLRDALGLWRGPPLAEFRYQEFARDEIARLEELRLVAQEERIEADLALGRHAEAVPDLEALIREHPLRERLRELLMLALYRAGRQADALAAYQDARATLVDELGLDPSESLQQLEKAILRHDPGLDTPGAVPRPIPIPATVPASEDPSLPRGTVTFLFTDIEGSTALLKELGKAYGDLLDAHREILRAVAESHEGREVDNQGDSFFFAFARANAAVAAAADAQRALARHEWPGGADVRVRMGLHTGEPSVGSDRYHGIGVHRAARIGAVAHGGQVLLSNPTRELVDDVPGVSIRELGSYQLKDIDQPERLFQLEIEGLPSEFPPPRAPKAPRRTRRMTLVGAGVAAIAVAAVLGGTFALSGSTHTLSHIDADAAGAIDPGSNHLVSEVTVGHGPGKLASGFGSVWVLNEFADTVSRVSPRTGTVQDTIPVGDAPTAIAVVGDSVWVLSSSARQLDRISPETDTVTQKTGVGNGPSSLAASPGALWVTNRLDDTVTEIDPTTGKRRRTLPAGPNPSAAAYGFGALWIANESAATVTRLDLDTGALEEIAVGNGPEAVAVGDGSVWVANRLDGTVSRIDPGQNVVSAGITVGAGPSSLLATDGSIWVADSYAGRVDRIDTQKNQIVSKVEVGSGPQALASFDGRVWLTTRQTSASHRGGTLRLYNLLQPDSVDSGLGYLGWNVNILTGDGLLTYRRVGGLEGSAIEPDLATSVPRATDAGRTYVFHLRRGIEYSTGQPVRASDFVRGFKRSIRIGPYIAYYFGGLLGGVKCTKTHCDLSRGIVADDRADTVTFHLRAPDAEFFDKLTLPGAYPVPPGVPMTRAELLGVPGTGPYEVQSYNVHKDADSHLVLVRNPHFRVWSAPAQPDGYPDRIEMTFPSQLLTAAGLTAALGEELTAVERGKADMMVGPPPSRRVELETRFAGQVHSFPETLTYGLFMNTRVPPFNNLLARRAVNFAVDRRKSISGNFGGTVTCQMLPPGMPGYRPYCPYTSHPTAGGLWSGPDLARARRLVAASGTKGAKIVFYAHDRPAAAVIGKVAVKTLNEIGYHATLKILPHDDYWQHVNTPANRTQAGFIGWSQDYPAPSEFLAQLTCAAYSSKPGSNGNQAEICDPSYDRAFNRALAGQETDTPQAANRSWSEVDRMATDLAAWAPLYNARYLVVVSKRVGNIQSNPQWGVLVDQMWVQ
jgi:peptide/nickel transport system substrate-binding protein